MRILFHPFQLTMIFLLTIRVFHHFILCPSDLWSGTWTDGERLNNAGRSCGGALAGWENRRRSAIIWAIFALSVIGSVRDQFSIDWDWRRFPFRPNCSPAFTFFSCRKWGRCRWPFSIEDRFVFVILVFFHLFHFATCTSTLNYYSLMADCEPDETD